METSIFEPAHWDIADTDMARSGLAAFAESPYMSPRLARLLAADMPAWLAATCPADPDQLASVQADACAEAAHLLSEIPTTQTLAREWYEVMSLCQTVSFFVGVVSMLAEHPTDLRPLLIAAAFSLADKAVDPTCPEKFGWVCEPDGSPVGAVVVNPDDLKGLL